MYFDVTNLNGRESLKYLPRNEFEWLTGEKIRF